MPEMDPQALALIIAAAITWYVGDAAYHGLIAAAHHIQHGVTHLIHLIK